MTHFLPHVTQEDISKPKQNNNLHFGMFLTQIYHIVSHMNICAFFHGVFLKHERPFGHYSLPRLEQHEGEMTIFLGGGGGVNYPFKLVSVMNKYWWYFLESTKRINNGNVKRPGSKPESLHSLQFPFLQWRWYITIGYSSISCSKNLSKSQPIIWEMETWPCFSYKALLTPERTSIYEKHLSAPLPIQHKSSIAINLL